MHPGQLRPAGHFLNLGLAAEYLGGVRPELAVLVNVFRRCFDGGELVERVHLASMCPTGCFGKFRVYRVFWFHCRILGIPQESQVEIGLGVVWLPLPLDMKSARGRG